MHIGDFVAMLTGCRYIPTVKGGNFLRALRRCVTPTRDRAVYSLNSATCPPGFRLEAILGYVR
jgi:hypothetical protein